MPANIFLFCPFHVVALDKGQDFDPKQPKYKSILFGDKGGVCDNAQTDERYERCGLATDLMTLCFQDLDITKNGGVDPNEEEQFKNNPDKQKEAVDGCAKIVTLNQSANPPAAGKAYTRAAIKAGFKKVFTVYTNSKQSIKYPKQPEKRSK